MLRVDHAGEYGAQRIYDGQLAVLGAGRKPTADSAGPNVASAAGATTSDIIEEMRAQEIAHLRTLERLLPAYRVRPTALLPLWHVAGWALGAASAALGPKTAMACTVAVEEVITSHYNAQLRTLAKPGFDSETDRELRAVLKKHRDDEEEHKHIGLHHEAEKAPFYSLVTGAIQAGCHAAIWASRKV
jgi:ubiquinone biosynthesis monooxygenase Coq7